LQIDLEGAALGQQGSVVVTVAFVIYFLLLLILVEVVDLLFPLVDLLDLLGQLADLVRGELQGLGFLQKVSKLLLFVY